MSEFVYWEQQDGALCAVHALNSLIQFPFWDAFKLAEVARGIDQEERNLSTYWISSQNVREDGFFSVQAITRALQRHSLTLDYLRPDMNPQLFEAFIFNLDLHWFTIRKKSGVWYNLDSISSSPRIITEFNLLAMIGSLKDQGFTVFFITGLFPTFGKPAVLEKNQYVFSKAQISAHQDYHAKMRKDEESQVQEAIRRSMQMHNQSSLSTIKHSSDFISYPNQTSELKTQSSQASNIRFVSNDPSFASSYSISSFSLSQGVSEGSKKSATSPSQTSWNYQPPRYERLYGCQLSEEEQVKLAMDLSKNEM